MGMVGQTKNNIDKLFVEVSNNKLSTNNNGNKDES